MTVMLGNQGIKIVGMEEAMKLVADLGKKGPWILKGTLDKTAKDVKEAQQVVMRSVFDRPTPYAQGALFTQNATTQNLTSKVWLKDKYSFTSGTKATEYLLPHIIGGERGFKGFEKALFRVGVLPAGLYCVPGAKAPLDAYGNISRGFLVQIISYFQAFGEQGYRANITGKRKAKLKKGTKKNIGYEYFAIRKPGGRLRPGIYRKTYGGGFSGGSFSTTGSSIEPVIMFVRKPTYRARWDFWRVGIVRANSVWRQNFEESFKAEMARE